MSTFELIGEGFRAVVDGEPLKLEHLYAAILANAAPEMLRVLELIYEQERLELSLPKSIYDQLVSAIALAKG